MRIAVFGPPLSSPHAGYFCGILGAFYLRGHLIHYYETETPEEGYNLQPSWGTRTRYAATSEAALRAVESAADADLLIKASQTGPCGALITEALLDLQGYSCQVLFWDTNPSATLAAIHHNPASPLHRLIPRFDQVLTNGGGTMTNAIYHSFGASRCTAIHPAIDPTIHHPVPPEERFHCELAFHADRLPCDEARTHEFFFNQADQLQNRRFILWGKGWEELPSRSNLQVLEPLSPQEQNCLNASATAVLSLSSNADSTSRLRLLEAAGAGACVITDAWTGIEDFLEPENEMIVASTAEEVALLLDNFDPDRARAIGQAALRRVLNEHTYSHRALQLEEVLSADYRHSPTSR